MLPYYKTMKAHQNQKLKEKLFREKTRFLKIWPMQLHLKVPKKQNKPLKMIKPGLLAFQTIQRKEKNVLPM